MNPLRDVVPSAGPRPELADKLQLFGQFVGSWDLQVTDHEPAGSRTAKGEWHFGWALDGRAIQDVWILPGREYGATLRFYDPRIDAWRSTWIGPASGYVLPFLAHRIGEEIVLHGSFQPGVTTRWIFSDITADTFRWRSVESVDGGQTWRLKQEMSARRKG